MANLGYVQVTRRCNQCCLFCSNPELDVDLELPSAVARIDELAEAGYQGVILTGGEPTLHPELPAMIAHAVASGLPPRIVTNGQRIGAEPGLGPALAEAGLAHVHLSLYSHRRDVVAALTGVAESFDRAWAALEHLERLQPAVSVDLNAVINRANADHLDGLVRAVVGRFGFVRHVVFNNLDPFMNRVAEHPETVPRLWAFELSLHRALRWLQAGGRSFRVERVPLCYMTGFAHASTET
ncbi:MAG: radical SAM protein, partial [Myxococcota bacterium]|nr:radical SAM protein [Myxococcota bacterium]